MPIFIENNTSDPVDYDVSVEGGGNFEEAQTTVAGSKRPIFSIGADGTFEYELAESGTCRHTFVVNPSVGPTQAKTVIEVDNASSDFNLVRLESTRVGTAAYYRIDLSKTT